MTISLYNSIINFIWKFLKLIYRNSLIFLIFISFNPAISLAYDQQLPWINFVKQVEVNVIAPARVESGLRAKRVSEKVSLDDARILSKSIMSEIMPNIPVIISNNYAFSSNSFDSAQVFIKVSAGPWVDDQPRPMAIQAFVRIDCLPDFSTPVYPYLYLNENDARSAVRQAVVVAASYIDNNIALGGDNDNTGQLKQQPRKCK